MGTLVRKGLRLVIIGILAATPLALTTGCGWLEDRGDDVGDAADDAWEGTKDAADDVKDAAEDVVD